MGDWRKAALYLAIIIMWSALLTQEKAYNRLKKQYDELFEASKTLTDSLKQTTKDNGLDTKDKFMQAETWLLGQKYHTPFVTSYTLDKISKEYADANKIEFNTAKKQVSEVFDYWKYESDREEDYEQT